MAVAVLTSKLRPARIYVEDQKGCQQKDLQVADHPCGEWKVSLV